MPRPVTRAHVLELARQHIAKRRVGRVQALLRRRDRRGLRARLRGDWRASLRRALDRRRACARRTQQYEQQLGTGAKTAHVFARRRHDAHGYHGSGVRSHMSTCTTIRSPPPTATSTADGADRMGDGLLSSRRALRARADDRRCRVSHAPRELRRHARDPGPRREVVRQAVRRRAAQGGARSERREVTRLGLHAVVEGLNEWDLFNTRPYNDGVLPAGVDAVGVRRGHTTRLVRGRPSARHPGARPIGRSSDRSKRTSTSSRTSRRTSTSSTCTSTSAPTRRRCRSQRSLQTTRFQGAGKPLWVTETGVSAVRRRDRSAASRRDHARPVALR